MAFAGAGDEPETVSLGELVVCHACPSGLDPVGVGVEWLKVRRGMAGSDLLLTRSLRWLAGEHT